MPVQVKDPTDIQSAYDEAADPTARTSSALSNAEASTSDKSYVDSGLDQAEAYANDPANHVKEGEETGASSGNWAVNRSGSSKGGSSLSRGQKLLKGVKKGGPFGAIVGVLVGGASVVSFLGGPGLLIVNFAEVLTDKLNYQLGVMDARYSKIVEAKLKNTTSGVCTSATSRLCKYSTFSDKEIAKFEKAGLKVNKSGSSITGRTKISSFEIEVGGVPKTITAADFKSALKNIPEFKSAMKSAYNMKYIGTSDSIFSKMMSHFKTSKAKPFSDTAADDDARATELDEKTKNGVQEADLNAANICDKAGECNEDDEARNNSGAKNATEAVDDAASNSDSVANRVLNEATDTAAEATEKTGEKIAKDVEAIAAKAGAKTAWDAGSSTIKITGIADNVCMVYGWVKGFSFAAKAIRAAQIARYAMMFLSTASMIKAGVAKAEDVSYLGNLMTKVVTANGKKTKAATDSIGYRSLAFGDTGATNSSLNAVAGASFPPLIQNAIDFVINAIGRNGIDQTCHVLANPFVQAGSLIVGIASFFAGVGEVKFTAQMVIAPVIALIGAFLPTMLGEILAGKVVTTSTFGEVTGDLIASGAGGLLSKSSSMGGGAILSRSQAVAYMQYQNQVAADYADYERQTTSPFDASNPNTFLGSIYTQFTPYLSQMSSVTGAMSNIGSIVLASVSNVLSPTTSAASATTYDACTDMVVTDLDMATDIFCNPVTGIPTEYLNEDPETVFTHLQSAGDIDSDGNPISQRYKDLITNCIDREAPYGVSNTDEVDNTGTCFINDQTTAEMYLFRADSRIIDGIEGDISTGSDEEGTGDDPSYSTPAGTCPAGTDIVSGIGTGWAEDGTEKNITLCSIPNTSAQINPGWTNKKYQGTSSKGISKIVVNNDAAASLLKAATKYKQETGNKLSASVGYRSVYEQCSFFMNGKNTPSVNQRKYYNKYCKPNTSWLKYPTGNWTTPVVISNHMMGKSVDFTAASEKWLRSCVHDSTDGKSDNRCYGFYDDVFQSEQWDSGHFTYAPK